jgi:hypothetical protein
MSSSGVLQAIAFPLTSSLMLLKTAGVHTLASLPTCLVKSLLWCDLVETIPGYRLRSLFWTWAREGAYIFFVLAPSS